MTAQIKSERGAKSLNIEHVGAVYDRPNQVRKDRAVEIVQS